MRIEVKEQLERCLELLAKIREEYPDGDFDREMLHGDMDFRYRQIKEDREKLEGFPPIVQDFAKLIDSLTTPDEVIKTFFRSIIKKPKHFSALASIPFHRRQKQLDEWAADLGIRARYINELLTRTRLSGILDKEYILDERYLDLIYAYLNLR